MDDMYANGDQQPPEVMAGAEQEEVGSTSIELKIKQDGSMVVCMEVGDAEADEQEVPAKNLDDAIRIIKQMASGVMGSMSTPAMQEEEAAFKQEMAA